MGWTESYILDELPLCRAYAYMHCIYRAHDIPCYYVYKETDKDAFAVFEKLRAGLDNSE